MRIQHNISALNAHRQLGNNNSFVSRNLEKLSSGYRINKAGDDAAGLAISEKMRAQIKGLDTAQKNAQDGISLVQTAEGALTEVHSMLNRMTELATQSANGTYQNETDRENLQKEVNSLKKEIDRIAASTNYNGIKLLDGSLSEGKVSGTLSLVAGGGLTGVETAAVGGSTKGNLGALAVNKDVVVKYTDADGAAKTINIGKTSEAIADSDVGAQKMADMLNKNAEFSSMFEAKVTNTKDIEIVAKTAGTKAPKATAVTMDTTDKALAAGTTAANGKTAFTLTADLAAGDVFEIDGHKYTMGAADDAEKGVFKDAAGLIALAAKDGYTVTAADLDAATTITFTKASGGGEGLKLQIGDSSDDFNQVTVSVGNMNSQSLGIGDVDISTQDGADAAIDKIKKAIDKVSSTRGDLGALQNRLDHTINNLGVASENMSAAESRIRDVDMAKEMMDFTKNNILTQASQAMLAQANQLPQGVLQLLQ